jgi:hypothetical protein
MQDDDDNTGDMTFRKLLPMMTKFAQQNQNHEALDKRVVVRVQTSEDQGDELHIGGLRRVSVDAGCTDSFALVIDADQEPDADTNSDVGDPDSASYEE